MIGPQAAGGRHLSAFRERHAREGEFIIGALAGFKGRFMGRGQDVQRNGALIVTPNRVVFYRKGLFGEIIESMPLSKITSVEMKSTLGVRALTLHTSHDSLKISTLENKTDFDLVRDLIERARDGDSRPKTIPPVAGKSPRDLLQHVANLHSEGLITDAEFATKRAEIIARI